MITISKSPQAPDYSYLHGDPFDPDNPPHTRLLETGYIINSQILDLNQDEHFSILAHVIMPDHIHILWHVKYWLPKDLGYYVGLFKSRCTKNWREQNTDIINIGEISLFSPKFNDRIAFDEKLAVKYSRYILDNPRRRILTIKYPHFFNKARKIRILDYEMDVYGNFQLLKHPLIAAAVVSSRYSPEERNKYERAWEETIRGAGVFVSPFISKAEQALRQRILDEGGNIIRIVADGIGPKYKPQGEEFGLCAEGRCLHVGSPRNSMHKETLGRQKCLALNDVARWIASHPTDMMTLLGLRTSE